MGRLTLAAGLALALLAGCGSGHAQPGIALHVAQNPFRLTVVDDGKTVVAEDATEALSYEVRGKAPVFTLTKVLSSADGVYRVATTEPGRTATVSVRRRNRGFSISVRLHPATGVAQILDAFDTKAGEHFLGGGEHADQVDLRGQIVAIKVSYQCSSAPVPYFASSAGWGLRLETQRVAGLAFPGSKGGPGCLFGGTSCSFQPLGNLTEACVTGARLDEEPLRRVDPADARRVPALGRRAGRPAALRARADQVA